MKLKKKKFHRGRSIEDSKFLAKIQFFGKSFEIVEWIYKVDRQINVLLGSAIRSTYIERYLELRYLLNVWHAILMYCDLYNKIYKYFGIRIAVRSPCVKRLTLIAR